MEKQLIDSVVLELMASRVCHDLISPVGAINNGIEFLEDDMGSENIGEAVELIAMSAQSAAARLQLFRIAYGTGGRDSTVKPEDAHKVFAAFLEGEGKIKQLWNPLTVFAGMDRPDGFSKMLVCGLILAQEALPKGGTIDVQAEGIGMIISGEGPDATIRPQVDKALNRSLDVSVVDPRLVHPYISGIMAAQYGFTITIGEQSPGKIAFKIVQI